MPDPDRARAPYGGGPGLLPEAGSGHPGVPRPAPASAAGGSCGDAPEHSGRGDRAVRAVRAANAGRLRWASAAPLPLEGARRPAGGR
ncbi:MAG: hypothetical protein LBQ79_12900 [Deltaproteobacteria bacterium]|nr:hypothetical protein [Deltaproteobacteria bacterium]